MWRNLLRRPRQPDATAMHALQVETLHAQLSNALATVTHMQRELEALRVQLQRAENDYLFMCGMYRENCPKEGKHQ